MSSTISKRLLNKPNSVDISSLRYWLALLRVPGFGCRSFVKILATHTPEQVFSESLSGLQALGIREKVAQAIKAFDWNQIEPDLAWLQQTQHTVITFSEAEYPNQLKQIADPPPLLFVRGNLQLLTQVQIAIVGSRNPSLAGRQTAFEFAYHLAQSGLTITSGLALGIDAAGHEGALKANGHTVAVAGTGLDRVYPAAHKNLATEIVTHGVMISEFPIGTVAKASHFPQRNRIISGLSRGLLVVEASLQSGSLITARLAVEQNRDVFAIPGAIQNPLARGCHALIKEGAKLVESHHDILQELQQYYQYDSLKAPQPAQTELDLAQQKLLNLIMFSPTSVDALVDETGYSAEVVSSLLLLLELHGYISATPGGGYLRTR
jgi:DNA processing protein